MNQKLTIQIIQLNKEKSELLRKVHLRQSWLKVGWFKLNWKHMNAKLWKFKTRSNVDSWKGRKQLWVPWARARFP